MITVSIHLRDYVFKYVASEGTKWVAATHKNGSYGGFAIFVESEASGIAIVDALRRSQDEREEQAAA